MEGQGSYACDSESVPSLCPAVRVNIDWHEWALHHVAFPALVQLVLSLVLLLLFQPLYTEAFHRYRKFKWWLECWVGTVQTPEVSRPEVLVLLYSAELIASLAALFFWVIRTYQRRMPTSHETLGLAIAVLDAVCWLINRLRQGFTLSGLFSANSVVDLLTTVPTFLGRSYDSRWLSLHFLRAYSALFAFEAIQNTGFARYRAVYLKMVVHLALRIVSLVIIMAGSILTFEILGDPNMLYDTFVLTGVGDHISFLQMVYWIIVSITTVGYGDFVPRTIVSRILTSLFIIVGISAIYVIQIRTVEVWRRQREGSGRYRAHNRSRHVTVILAIRGPASQVSGLITGFLQEIFHPAHLEDNSHDDVTSKCRGWSGFLRASARRRADEDQSWPDVVFLSPRPWDSGGSRFRDFLQSNMPLYTHRKVSFLVGAPDSKPDLDRASVLSASLTYVLTDESSDEPHGDDIRAINLSMILKSHFPNVRIRLMLQLPESKELAVQSGIELTRCCSSRELKMNILAQNTRCHGLLAALSSMLGSSNRDDEERFLDAACEQAEKAKQGFMIAGHHGSCSSMDQILNPSSSWRGSVFNPLTKLGIGGQESSGLDAWGGDRPPSMRSETMEQRRKTDLHWVHEYFVGLSRKILGFTLNKTYEGLSFGELSTRIFKDTGGAIVLGLQEEGKLRIVPQEDGWISEAGQVYFVIASDVKMLDNVRQRGENRTQWRNAFVDRRNSLIRNRRNQGPHRAASEFMGAKLARFLDDFELPENGSESQGQSLPLDSSLCKLSALVGRASSPAHELAQPASQLMDIRQQTHERPLVVLVVCNPTRSIGQLSTFIVALRQPYLPIWPAVVVLAPQEPDPSILENEHVYWLEGSCVKATSLINAGVLEAREVVVITGRSLPGEGELRDNRVVLCSHVLECWLGPSPTEVFCSFEFQESVAVQRLPKLRSRPGIALENVLTGAVEGVMNDYQPRRGSMGGMIGCDDDETDGADALEKESVLFHPRFAAGQVFTPELWGTMAGRMYYMPATIEFVEAIVMPFRRGQHTFPWQVRMPSFYSGRTFSDLYHDWVAQRCSNKRDQADGARNGIEQLGPAVPIAIYRRRAQWPPVKSFKGAHTSNSAKGIGGRCFVLLGPEAEMVLRSSDWIIVLGSESFGREMHKRGLLRDSPHPADPEGPYGSIGASLMSSDDLDDQILASPFSPDDALSDAEPLPPVTSPSMLSPEQGQ